MRTAFGLLFLAAMQADQVAAVESPFVGKYADATSILEDGRITSKLSQEEGFNLRGFERSQKFNLNSNDDRSFTSLNLDQYFKSSSKMEQRLQRMVDTKKARSINKKSRRTGKKVLREDPQISMNNHYDNMVYTGPLYMGSEKE